MRGSLVEREERGGVFAAAFCRLSVRASDVGRSRYGRMADKHGRRGGVCLMFALRSFCVRGRTRALYGRATDRQRTSDRRRTGGHSSDADILRHSEMGGGARWAELPRACLRTSDGRRTGGHSSDADILRHSEMGGGARRTCHGRGTDSPQAAHGLAYGLLTDGRRAGFGQTWTSPDVPRWAAADCAAHGLETDA